MENPRPRRRLSIALLLILPAAVAIVFLIGRLRAGETAPSDSAPIASLGRCAEPTDLSPVVYRQQPEAAEPHCLDPAPPSGIYRIPVGNGTDGAVRLAVVDGCIGVSDCPASLVWRAGDDGESGLATVECPVDAHGNPAWRLELGRASGGRLRVSFASGRHRLRAKKLSPEVRLEPSAKRLIDDPRPEVLAAALEAIARDQDDPAACENLQAALAAAARAETPRAQRAFDLARAPCVLPALEKVAIEEPNPFIAREAAGALDQLELPGEVRIQALMQVSEEARNDVSAELRDLADTLGPGSLEAAFAAIRARFERRPTLGEAAVIGALVAHEPKREAELFRIAGETADCGLRSALLTDHNDDLNRHLDQLPDDQVPQLFRPLLMRSTNEVTGPECDRSRELAGSYFSRWLHEHRRSKAHQITDAWKLAIDASREEGSNPVRQALIKELGRCQCLVMPVNDEALGAELAQTLALPACRE